MLNRVAAKRCWCRLLTHYTKPLHLSRTLTTTTHHNKCHYTILGVPRTASQEEIRNAYLEKTKLYHPDANPNDEKSHTKFIDVQQAYEALQLNSTAQNTNTAGGGGGGSSVWKEPKDYNIWEDEDYHRERPDFFHRYDRSRQEPRTQTRYAAGGRPPQPKWKMNVGLVALFSVVGVLAMLNTRRAFNTAYVMRERRDENYREYIREIKGSAHYDRQRWVKEVEGYDVEQFEKKVVPSEKKEKPKSLLEK